MKSKSYCSTLGDIKIILAGLKAENNPQDKELIAFYENKIAVETAKALRKLDVKKMLQRNDNDFTINK